MSRDDQFAGFASGIMKTVERRGNLWYNAGVIMFCQSATANSLWRDDRHRRSTVDTTISQNSSQSNDVPVKLCPKCRLWLQASLFSPNKNSKGGLASWCKACCAKRAKETVTPEKQRDRDLRHKYGITKKQYDQMIETQRGLCAICGKPETRIDSHTRRPMSLRVDHDHKTGQVRELLCDGCNIILGMADDDFNRLRAIADYAERHKTKEPVKKLTQLDLFIPDMPAWSEETK